MPTVSRLSLLQRRQRLLDGESNGVHGDLDSPQGGDHHPAAAHVVGFGVGHLLLLGFAALFVWLTAALAFGWDGPFDHDRRPPVPRLFIDRGAPN